MTFDANQMFRTTGNLTQAESNGPVTVRSTPVGGLAARLVIPTAFHDDDTIQAKYYHSTDGSTYYLFAQSRSRSGWKSAPGDLITPIVTPYKYIKEELTVTSTTAANVNFGAVKSGVVLSQFEWSRTVGFE